MKYYLHTHKLEYAVIGSDKSIWKYYQNNSGEWNVFTKKKISDNVYEAWMKASHYETTEDINRVEEFKFMAML